MATTGVESSSLKEQNTTQQPQESSSPTTEISNVDRISQMPDEILHSILSLLTIKDSTITTSLSKHWSYVFPTLPHLHFNFDSFSKNSIIVGPSNIWVQCVWDVLESRIDPLKSCHITYQLMDRDKEMFYEILSFLCGSTNFEQLTVDNYADQYKLPKCIFSCQTLVRLELFNCNLLIHPEFTAMCCLRTLKIDSCIVPDNDIGCLISGCPALERLCFNHCYRTRKLVIRANNLRELDISIHRPLAIRI